MCKVKKSLSSKKILIITQMALLFALSIVLMFLENMIPPIPTLPPGVKLGLSNIVVMYCLFFLGKRAAFVVLLLKSVFVFLTRGVIAFFLSFSGGIFSILIMILLLGLKREKVSYIIISMCSAIAHNMAQLCVSSLLLKNRIVFYYMPVLIISGIIMGLITGIILGVMIPAMKRLNS